MRPILLLTATVLSVTLPGASHARAEFRGTPKTAAAARHVKLLRSVPAANDTLTTAPAQVRLWFNERVEIDIARVRLTGPDRQRVQTGKAVRIDGEPASAFQVSLPADLSSGRYDVQWTAASEDGHPMKGTFAFVVRRGPTQ